MATGGLVIITTPAHPMLAERLEKAGLTVWYAPAEPPDRLRERLPEAVALVVSTRVQIDRSWIDSAPNLQWIGRLGSGMELIDVNYAQTRGIRCVSSPEGNRLAVAEHVLGLMLALSNNLLRAAQEVQQGIWERDGNRGFEWTGKTLGIVGFGNTGSEVARVVRGLDMTILAHDKYRFGFGSDAVREASLEQIARYADVISFHLPLTQETRHYANAAFFSQLLRKPVILNASRGEVVDTAALWHALENEQVSAVGLDVLENEKLATWLPHEKALYERFLAHPRAIITPHIAGYSHEATYKMSAVLLEKLGY